MTTVAPPLTRAPAADSASRRPRIALALGSGGARGFAHIGVIQVLEESGFEIVSVAGSSMGAVIGGLYAAAKLDAYTEWVSDLSHMDVLRLFDLSLSAPGAVKAERIFVRMRDLIGGALIEELPTAFTAVATDVTARRAVWFQHGPLEVALRASIAIPGVFTPVMLDGRLLVDGGVLEPLPIAPTVSSEADATIAVDLGGATDPIVSDASAEATSSLRSEWMDRLRGGASRVLDGDRARSLVTRFGRSTPDAGTLEAPAPDPVAFLPPGLTKFDVMNMSLEAMQSVLKAYTLAANPPDVLITVPKDACRSLDFRRAPELIEIGRALTAEALTGARLTA